MSHIYNDKGQMIPVTIIWCDKNVVVGHKTTNRNAYSAVQVATSGSKHLLKPLQLFLKKANIDQPLGVIREFKTSEDLLNKFTPGSEVELTQFHEGDNVSLTSMSKGKGFAGTIKRHQFSRGPKTHGSNNYRQPGSIGAQQPQRVVKGKKMAGHMGFTRVTVANIPIVRIDPKNRLIALKGSVPGSNRFMVEIRKQES